MTTEYTHEAVSYSVTETVAEEEIRELFERRYQNTYFKLKPGAPLASRVVHFHLLKKIAARTDLSDETMKAEKEIYSEIYYGSSPLNKRAAFMRTITGTNPMVDSKQESAQKTDNIQHQVNDPSEDSSVVRDFSFLTLMGQINTVAGWLIFFAAVILMIVGGNKVSAGEEGLTLLMNGAFFLPAALVVLAAGQMIHCFVSIENNGHQTNKLLKRLLEKDGR